jgi:tellurite resistance protein TerC
MYKNEIEYCLIMINISKFEVLLSVNFYLMNPPIVIIVFIVLIVLILAFDLGLFTKVKQNKMAFKKALLWTTIWVGLAMLFSLFVLKMEGFEKFAQFQSAYWIEEALSVDNLFVFLLIFSFFNLEGYRQQKVLLWGIIGAIVFRAIFIFSGVGLINLTYLPEFSIGNWHFTLGHTDDKSIDYTTNTFHKINVVMTLFGLFLIYAGIKSGISKEDSEHKDYNKSLAVRLVAKIIPLKTNFDGDNFFQRVEHKGKLRLYGTKLLLVLIIVESSDLLFAVDSIPAIFAIAPNDPFILYSSNIFAILGLRSLFFLLANSMELFSKLKYGLAIILSFIGLKMLIAPIYHIETLLSLLIVVSVLMGSIVISILTRKKSAELE